MGNPTLARLGWDTPHLSPAAGAGFGSLFTSPGIILRLAVEFSLQFRRVQDADCPDCHRLSDAWRQCNWRGVPTGFTYSGATGSGKTCARAGLIGLAAPDAGGRHLHGSRRVVDSERQEHGPAERAGRGYAYRHFRY